MDKWEIFLLNIRALSLINVLKYYVTEVNSYLCEDKKLLISEQVLKPAAKGIGAT
jgi:hypothetical protein